MLVLFRSVFSGSRATRQPWSTKRAHLARADVSPLGSQQCRRLGCWALITGLWEVALGPWLETASPGPALSGTGRPAGKGEGGALQARDLCPGLSTGVPFQHHFLPVNLFINDLKVIRTPAFSFWEVFCWFCCLVPLTKKKDSGRPGLASCAPFPSLPRWVHRSSQLRGRWFQACGAAVDRRGQQTRGSRALPAQVCPLPPPGVAVHVPCTGVATRKTRGSAGGLAAWLGGCFFARGPRS